MVFINIFYAVSDEFFTGHGDDHMFQFFFLCILSIVCLASRRIQNERCSVFVHKKRIAFSEQYALSLIADRWRRYVMIGLSHIRDAV